MKKNNIFITFLFLLLFLNVYIVFADDYKIWYSKGEVDLNKKWTIKFNLPLNEDSIENNIMIKDIKAGKLININLAYDEIDNSIKVSPRESYMEGKPYELIIQEGIKSSKNKNMSKPVKYVFTTKANGQNSYMPGDEILKYEDFYEALKVALSNFEDEIVLTIRNYDKETYDLDIINKIINENPLLDYGYNGAKATSSYYDYSEVTMTIKFNYLFDKQRMIYMRNEAEKKAQEIINKVIKPDMKDYEKELALHDYLVNNSRYDTRLFTGNMSDESFTDYGVLVEGIGVCSSYAKTMYRLLNSIGIETIYVTGKADNGSQVVNHAWNLVKIQGEYYHLDATWNDPISSDGKDTLSHTYFNVTDEQISKNHTWNRSDFPKSNSTKYSFDNLDTDEMDNDGDVISKVTDYEGFYREIKSALEKGKTNVSLKILDYDVNTYDINSVLEKIINENHSINYKGCYWTHYDDDLSGAKYIKIYFNK